MSDFPEPSKTIQITPPISFEGREYTDLVLREPTAGEVLVGDMQLRNGVTQEALRTRQMHIISRVAGVPVPVIQKLRISQQNEAWAYVSAFLDIGLATFDSSAPS